MRVLLYYPRALAGDGGMTHAVRTLADELTSLGTNHHRVRRRAPGPTNDGIRWVDFDMRRVCVRIRLAFKGHSKRLMFVVLHSAWTLKTSGRRHRAPRGRA